MASVALASLTSHLADADAMVSLAGSAPPGLAAAAARASVVLMYGAFEAFVEGLFRECFDLVVTADPAVLGPLRERPLERFNNPELRNVDVLFAQLGLSAVTTGVSWGGESEQSVRSDFGQVKTIRHDVAHGTGVPSVSVALLPRYRAVVMGVAGWLDGRVADFVHTITGTRPW
jgi:hypothetical protein